MLSIMENRRMMAAQLCGDGIEFGALMAPTPLPPTARARYADHRSTQELRDRYPKVDVKPVDIVLKSNDLSEIEDRSCDFIIANQVIEHLPNPLGGLEVWARKLKLDGTLFISYPLGRYCPDKARPITTLDHLISDYNRNTDDSCNEHILAFGWAWNAMQFKNPAEIEQALHHLWAYNLEEMDDVAWSYIKEDRAHVKHILSDRHDEVHHHVFDTRLILDCVSFLEQNTGLKPTDFSSGRGLLSEEIIVLRREANPEFAGRLEAELWVHSYIEQQQEFIRRQIERA
jgi:SAM-dependent methyltransferase